MIQSLACVDALSESLPVSPSSCLSTTTFSSFDRHIMASSPPWQIAPRQPFSAFLPGAWPHTSQDVYDPDVTTASYPAMTDHTRTDETSNERAQRRWSYAGPASTSPSKPPCPATPTSPSFVPLTASTSQDSRMSQFTENTLSSAASSALNTPDLVRWTHLSSGMEGSQQPMAFAADDVPCHTVGIRFGKETPSPHHDHFASPYLDPPLLNIVPSLRLLKLPNEVSSGFGEDGPPRLPPSPLAESCAPPPLFSIPSPRRDYHQASRRSSTVLSPSGLVNDFFPIADVTPDPSPQLTIASLPTSLYVSDADSLVIPPPESDDIHTTGYHHSAFVQTTPSAPEMDAFALAAAVASSASRSSLSIPPSIQSFSCTPATGMIPLTPEVSRPCTHRDESNLTQASTGHRSRDAPSPGYLAGVSEHGQILDIIDDARPRRRSAPPPTVGQTPRPVVAKIISSRVDVGDQSSTRKAKMTTQPVLGKMRRFGERLRGLFKSKGASPPKKRGSEAESMFPYGLMTTTTAVTNVEYQSEHPIPLPSPRAKIMRNHRRSLPLPSVLLPSSADALASVILRRPTANRSNTSRVYEVSPRAEREHERVPPGQFSSHMATDPTQSPHTPRPRRQRYEPTQENESEDVREDDKTRRFSLSSALSRSRLEAIRSTVMPRPPLPSTHSRSTHEHGSAAALSRTGTRRSSFGTTRSNDWRDRSTPSGSYWGGELPSVKIIRDSHESSSRIGSPRRTRTQTAPSGPHGAPLPEAVTNTPKAKRPRRFSLSSMLARRASRSRVALKDLDGRSEDIPIPDVPELPSKALTVNVRSRHRGDTVTTITQGVPFDLVQPRQGLDLPTRPLMPPPSCSNRISLVSSVASSQAVSAYFDAREQLTEEHHRSSFEADRSCSPGPESDLDSMSFARTPDYSSGTFSFGSVRERDRSAETDDLSLAGSYAFRSNAAGRCASTSAVSRLVNENTSASLTKTLRFSPSLSLSLERSWSDGEDDDLRRMDQEDRGFMRALGFEFDEIARRAREQTY
ncbi:hypothetical protein BD414DRAFT_245623 [Trametes punicea]|nr:hypothetical protein BD414DRAFT_245623 [Trametes punicea]